MLSFTYECENKCQNIGTQCRIDGDPYERLDTIEANAFHNPFLKEPTGQTFIDLHGDLEFLDQHGVVHQDIRPANVGLRGSRATLLDFAFASVDSVSKFGNNIQGIELQTGGYCGTRETASNRILALLSQDQMHPVEVTHRDDLESLYKMHYIFLNGPYFLGNSRAWENFLQKWKSNGFLKITKGQNSAEFSKELSELLDDAKNVPGLSAFDEGLPHRIIRSFYHESPLPVVG